LPGNSRPRASIPTRSSRPSSARSPCETRLSATPTYWRPPGSVRQPARGGLPGYLRSIVRHLPERCVEALRRQRAQQAADRLSAGERWRETGLVFTTSVGTKMLAGNVRRDFRRALALVPSLNPWEWTPENYDTRLSRYFPMQACRWSRSRNWSDTAAQRSPNWCTGTSCGR
jgi:hypothetical protein